MRFRYIGDSDNMTAYGYDFRDGATPDVTDANAIGKLSGNRFFEAVEVSVEEIAAPKAMFGAILASIEQVQAKNKGGRPRKVQPTEA